jgi:energy-coupling factor transport system permease protein
MHERLSFYIRRDSAIHRLNPLTKLVGVLTLILLAFLMPYYWSPHILALRLIIPTATFLFIMQALFQPIGEEIIFQFYFLDVTQESFLFAFRNAMRIVVMVSAFTIFLLTTHPSELMSDLTRRGLPAQFAYVIISTLQILPQMQAKAQTIIAAQRSRGLDTESTFLKRAGSVLPLVGPLVFGSLVEVEERAIAIEARGFTSKKVKTSFHEIPDTNSDKVLRWILIILIMLSISLNLWLS